MLRKISCNRIVQHHRSALEVAGSPISYCLRHLPASPSRPPRVCASWAPAGYPRSNRWHHSARSTSAFRPEYPRRAGGRTCGSYTIFRETWALGNRLDTKKIRHPTWVRNSWCLPGFPWNGSMTETARSCFYPHPWWGSDSRRSWLCTVTCALLSSPCCHTIQVHRDPWWNWCLPCEKLQPIGTVHL